MKRMRTIKAAIEEMRAIDPDTAFTEHALRGMVKRNEVPYFKTGRKTLIDLDALMNVLSPCDSSAPSVGAINRYDNVYAAIRPVGNANMIGKDRGVTNGR